LIKKSHPPAAREATQGEQKKKKRKKKKGIFIPNAPLSRRHAVTLLSFYRREQKKTSTTTTSKTKRAVVSSSTYTCNLPLFGCINTWFLCVAIFKPFKPWEEGAPNVIDEQEALMLLTRVLLEETLALVKVEAV